MEKLKQLNKDLQSIQEKLEAEKYGLSEELQNIIDEISNLVDKPVILQKCDRKFENFRDEILAKEKEGKIVIATWEGFMEADLDKIIDQPTEGLLYDLNRDRATILTYIEDKKWVNDFACMKVIEKLKALLSNEGVGLSHWLYRFIKLIWLDIWETIKIIPLILAVTGICMGIFFLIAWVISLFTNNFEVAIYLTVVLLFMFVAILHGFDYFKKKYKQAKF